MKQDRVDGTGSVLDAQVCALMQGNFFSNSFLTGLNLFSALAENKGLSLETFKCISITPIYVLNFMLSNISGSIISLIPGVKPAKLNGKCIFQALWNPISIHLHLSVSFQTELSFYVGEQNKQTNNFYFSKHHIIQ